MPIFLTNPIETFPIGNIPLDQHPLPSGIQKHPHAWLSQNDIISLNHSTHSTIVDSQQRPLAWKNQQPDPTNSLHATTSFLIEHPWELLRANQLHLEQIPTSENLGTIHPSAVIEGTLHLGQGSRILPGVFIEGIVAIGENCKIGPNCYIRGTTSIGHHCHIGQAVEVKNSIILSHTAIGHLSYVGDSVIGKKVNFGAGTITSNFRHDGKNHRTMLDGQLIDTGLRKFGAIIGDNVHTGIHTSIYPGRKLHPNTSTLPGQIIQKDLTE